MTKGVARKGAGRPAPILKPQGAERRKSQMTSQEFIAIRKKMGLDQAGLAVYFKSYQPEISRIEKNGPTKKHGAHIRALLLLHKHGLLNKLKEEIENAN
jgi:DNA-binding transcriptional regulator YiaG